MIEQELPQLVDERRFRRREREEPERDELGRVSKALSRAVCVVTNICTSANGRKNELLLALSRCPVSICEHKSLAKVGLM
jgi:hypothetical protein